MPWMAGSLFKRRNPGQQLGLGHRYGSYFSKHRTQASFFAGLHLVAHIDLAGGVVSHQDHRQAGFDALPT